MIYKLMLAETNLSDDSLMDWTYITSTTRTVRRESRSPRLKKAGPADPVLNPKILKFAENQTKNI